MSIKNNTTNDQYDIKIESFMSSHEPVLETKNMTRVSKV